MRKLIAAFTIVFAYAMLPSDDANAQSRCKDGTAATLSGTIGSVDQFRPEPNVVIWVIKASGKPSGTCAVEQIWGNGQAPAACTKGKKFTATGKALDADSFWMLQTSKIECN